MSATFYKMRLVPAEEGVAIITERFISIRETECVHFCLSELEHNYNRCQQQPGETEFETAKRRKVKIWRINKADSRIAQPTEQAAFERLLFLKRKHVRHLERDLEMLKLFIGKAGEKCADDFDADRYGHRVIPGTQEWVASNYTFY